MTAQQNKTKLRQSNCAVRLLLSALLLPVCAGLWAQPAALRGSLREEKTGAPAAAATVAVLALGRYAESDALGNFYLPDLPAGEHLVTVFALGKNTWEQPVSLRPGETHTLDIRLAELSATLDAVTVQAARERTLGITRLRAVEGMAIYEGRKSEVVVLDDINANLATNNPRQVYARIAGLNIWESDGAGLQLGIGGRGLSPNRTSNFNTRQNGYDISADALGYPESYYTPPAEALARIEVVRGAASLQYGTQFGGMVNFVFKKPPRHKAIELTSRQTAGSYGFFGSFNSVAGALAGQKLTYYAYYQRKQGDGWRDNGRFGLHNAFASVGYAFSERLSMGVEYTWMQYLAQQPGGLTDAFFEQNPRQSLRDRNWFRVDWNLMALTLDYVLSDRTKVNLRSFGLLARRQALGNLAPINNIDFGGPRDLIDGRFRNGGSELRLLHRYRQGPHENTLLLGARLYKGATTARQGAAGAGSGPDFAFLNPNDVEKSDYSFPNYNYAFFLENIFHLGPRLTLTPGLRLENIQTYAEGYYKQRVFDAAGNLVVENRFEESLSRRRSFLLAGLGLSYKLSQPLELYANLSQNYRAINFSDLRIDNPNGRVDPNLRDERGYTADLGLRSRGGSWFYADLTAFYIAYRNRIGQLLRADEPPLYNDYRLRTNIADARNIGVEAFAEADLWHLLAPADTATRLALFINAAFIDARYINTSDNSIRNKRVELVAPVTLRLGLNYSQGRLRLGAALAYTAEHFTDATNARRTASAVNGVIPAYTVADFSAAYRLCGWLSLEMSCNNALNAAYFTRRAEAYPGPGIIPADGRSWFLTLAFKW